MPRTKAKPAETFDLFDALAQLPTTFLECRELQHNWFGYDVIEHEARLWEEVVQCSRCKAEKARYVNPVTGEEVRGWRSKHYEDGYLLTGHGRVSAAGRDVVRREALQRRRPSSATSTGGRQAVAKSNANRGSDKFEKGTGRGNDRQSVKRSPIGSKVAKTREPQRSKGNDKRR
jgi:hypothetical protein